MMMYKPYQTIMVLSLRTDGEYFDTRGTYIKEMTVGTQKGKHQVEINTVVLHFEADRLMDYEEYFKIWNSDKSKLPANANGKLAFLQGDYRSSGDG